MQDAVAVAPSPGRPHTEITTPRRPPEATLHVDAADAANGSPRARVPAGRGACGDPPAGSGNARGSRPRQCGAKPTSRLLRRRYAATSRRRPLCHASGQSGPRPTPPLASTAHPEPRLRLLLVRVRPCAPGALCPPAVRVDGTPRTCYGRRRSPSS